MPTYQNISNKTYVNTKYNIFNIQPGETFTIDKTIESPSLAMVDANPPVKYEGDVTYSISPGSSVVIDVSDYLEINLIPQPGGTDTDILYVCINSDCSNQPPQDKHTLTKNEYYQEEFLRIREYNTIMLEAPSTNTDNFVVKVGYMYV